MITRVIVLFCVAMIFSGWVNAEDEKPYKESACKYEPNNSIVHIKLTNGAKQKGIVVDNSSVQFHSTEIGMSFIKGYGDLTQITFTELNVENHGYLSVDFIEDGKTITENVGYVQKTCWANVKELLPKIPKSKKVAVVEK